MTCVTGQQARQLLEIDLSHLSAEADDNLNLGASAEQGRDFLRTRKEAGVGIIFSLFALQVCVQARSSKSNDIQSNDSKQKKSAPFHPDEI